MNHPRFPDWLQPFKNEWRTVGRLRRIMIPSCGSIDSLIHANKHRLRVVTEPCRNLGHNRSAHLVRRYLVKQVWALGVANCLDFLDPEQIAQDERKEAIDEREALRNEVSLLKDQLRRTNADRPEITQTDFISLLAMIMTATPARPVSGVYFLIEDSKIIYVGQSGNVLARMSGHTDKRFTEVRMIEVERDAERLRIERILIRMLKPVENFRHAQSSDREIRYANIRGRRK